MLQRQEILASTNTSTKVVGMRIKMDMHMVPTFKFILSLTEGRATSTRKLFILLLVLRFVLCASSLPFMFMPLLFVLMW